MRNKGNSHAEGSEEANQKGPQGTAHLLPPTQGQQLQCFWITEGLHTAHELKAWQSDHSSSCFYVLQLQQQRRELSLQCREWNRTNPAGLKSRSSPVWGEHSGEACSVAACCLTLIASINPHSNKGEGDTSQLPWAEQSNNMPGANACHTDVCPLRW